MLRLGATSLIVSRLGFGGWGIGGDAYGKTDDAVSTAAIAEALRRGCNLFDTADFYGEGHGERLLGRALADLGVLHTVVIATKGGRLCKPEGSGFDFSMEGLSRSVEGSLRRLKRDTIDLYQLHNPPLQVLRSGQIDDALGTLIGRGLIRYAGVSVDTVAEARAAVQLSNAAVLQMRYNLLSLLEPGMTLTDMMPRLPRDIGVLGREPLANGFLSGHHTPDRVYPPRDVRRVWPHGLKQQRISLAAGLAPLARNGRTLAQVALRFALDEPHITSVLVGMKTPEQVEENFGALALPPFDEIAAEL